uniref:DNA-directed RNA polymerase subunit gamma n=1 Tax=Capsosiphon fulvescens TaxID=205396 RepID=A0A3G1RIV3_9CHLO|nr:beta' subunit of RNA polymerase [Capsosiphon fulvescens]AWX64086.1 beta' subunit of RNA polymerase [Capsosiphon fulvescens]AYV90003.1 beta' subunit of RNA polymerase [Capsosiphon fulvescens]
MEHTIKFENDQLEKDPINKKSYIGIRIASPQRIKRWARRRLNGEEIGNVTNGQTLNYKTLKPEVGGLFCERIFGPVNDFKCSCGKQKTQLNPKYCPICGVQFISSRSRRHKMGWIELAAPVTHLWYLKGSISYISILLNLKKKDLETLAYCSKTLSSSVKSYSLTNNYYVVPQSFQWNSQKDWSCFLLYMNAKANQLDTVIPNYLKRSIVFDAPLTGGGAIQNLLRQFTCAERKDRSDRQNPYVNKYIDQISSRIKLLNPEIEVLESFFKYRIFFSPDITVHNKNFRRFVRLRSIRIQYFRRIKLLSPFKFWSTKPSWMVLSVLPVLPPDLRPVLALDSKQIAVSDLNQLYQRVIFRNQRVKRFSSEYALLNFSEEMRYAQRLLQEAVDALIENGKGDQSPMTASNNRPLKSLADMVKGKQGRFRQNLLGKRVDYSGRSVIVVGPTLKLHECGLPKQMALELFQPFLIRELINRKLTRNFLSAKKFIQQSSDVVWEILEQVVSNRPVLLNRAPTLHRLGIQAFQPKLTHGKAILLHPLVCNAFNADFDGDQMAVHVPLSYFAIAEAWKLMLSSNNLLSPATGEPILIPTQDMVLGCYYLTTQDPIKTKIRLQEDQSNDLVLSSGSKLKSKTSYFPKNHLFYSDITQVMKLFNLGVLDLHTEIWLRWTSKVETSKPTRKIEIRMDKLGNIIYISTQCLVYFSKSTQLTTVYIKTTPGRVKINQAIFDVIY